MKVSDISIRASEISLELYSYTTNALRSGWSERITLACSVYQAVETGEKVLLADHFQRC